MNRSRLLLAATSLVTLATAVWVPTVSAAAAVQSGPSGTEVEGVIVTADPLTRSHDDVITSVAVLRGDELVQRRAATLGETLNGLPGVNSDTFGAGASRPVIRGQTAPRVKVLSDGAAQLDASEVSPDHAVSGDPLLIERVEILRGPSALLYGGGAIGGAVNLVDAKVPTRIPENGGQGVAEVRVGSADNERAGVIGLTAGVGQFAVRVEAVERRSDDYEVPKFSEPTVDGSFSRSSTATLGLSWIGERGYLGAAYTEQNSRYGLPGHSHEYESCHPHGVTLHCGDHDESEGDDHDHDHDGEHGAVPVVDLKSRRVDVRGEIENPFTGVERIRLRGGFTDYRHHEMEDGVIATTFTNEGYDARVEAQHAPIGGLRGVVGGQVSRSDFAALGEEAFLPESITENKALFVVEEYQRGDWRFEGALRQEWQDTRAVGQADTDHKPLSISAAARWTFTPGYVASLSLARSQRAPTAQELYADGVHMASNTYEIGSTDLDVETAASIELAVRKIAGQTTFSASAYHYDYDGYIFADTLDRFEAFRLVRYTQGDARFTGLEGEVTHAFTPALSLTAFGDYVRAKLKDDGGNLPRIPAGRLGLRGDFGRGDWSGNVEYVHVFDQDRIAAFETKTPGYEMVNATLAYDVPLGGVAGQIFVRGTNLLDREALNHASFVRDAAPLRGRNFVLGLRARF